jgi:hypothetical protein
MKKLTYLAPLMAIACLTTHVVGAQGFDPVPMADANSDGSISLDEFKAFREQGWNFATGGAEQVKVSELNAMAKTIVTGVEPDGNGVVTHLAFAASSEDVFKAADTNKDGKLAPDELRAQAKMN